MRKSAVDVLDYAGMDRIGNLTHDSTKLTRRTNMFGLLFKASKDEKEILDSLRGLKTLRISDRGGMSIDTHEILTSKRFIEASKKARKIVANG